MSLIEFKSKVPHPLRITTIVFLLRNDEVLLAMKKRGFGEGHWNGVGGKVEPGESVEGAAIRETEEEIGVTPKKLVNVAVLNFYFLTVPIEDGWNQQVKVFFADQWSGEPIESEEMRPQWFKQTNLPLDTMWSDDVLWLPRVLAGEKLNADFAFDQDKQVAEHYLYPFSDT